MKWEGLTLAISARAGCIGEEVRVPWPSWSSACPAEVIVPNNAFHEFTPTAATESATLLLGSIYFQAL